MRLGGTITTSVFQESEDRIVELEADGATVRKEFRGRDLGLQLQLATEEYDRLELLWPALAVRRGLTCPRPIALEPGPPPALRMTLLPGEPLLDRLRRHCPDHMQAALATRLADGLEAYVGALGEAYDDFHLRNLLYRDNDGLLSLIDVGPAPTPIADPDPYLTSVANLIAGIIFEAARPHGAARRRQRSQSIGVARHLVEELRQRGHELPTRQLRYLALARYRALPGGPLRRLWFGTIGLFSANPGAIVAEILGGRR